MVREEESRLLLLSVDDWRREEEEEEVEVEESEEERELEVESLEFVEFEEELVVV